MGQQPCKRKSGAKKNARPVGLPRSHYRSFPMYTHRFPQIDALRLEHSINSNISHSPLWKHDCGSATDSGVYLFALCISNVWPNNVQVLLAPAQVNRRVSVPSACGFCRASMHNARWPTAIPAWMKNRPCSGPGQKLSGRRHTQGFSDISWSMCAHVGSRSYLLKLALVSTCRPFLEHLSWPREAASATRASLPIMWQYEIIDKH